MFKDISASLLLASLFTFIRGEYPDCPPPYDLPEHIPLPTRRMYEEPSDLPDSLPLPASRIREEPSEWQLVSYLLFVTFSFSVLLTFFYLVKRFYFTNAKDKSELHLAIEAGNLNCIRSLLDNGADIFEVDSEGNNPLHVAVINQHTHIVRLLLKKGAPINQGNNAGDTPLHSAVYCQDMALITLLLENGADITPVNHKRETLLTQMDSKEKSPLHCAAQEIYTGEQIPLLDHVLDIAEENLAGGAFLHYGTDRQSSASRELFLNRGAAINQVNNVGATPLHSALYPADPDDGISLAVIELLLERGAAINQGDDEGYSPLHYAICYGNIDVITFLLDRGADITQVNHKEETPITQVDKEGNTPLHRAVYCQDMALITFLLENGADITAVNHKRETPLTQADKGGNTPLHRAVEKKSVDLIRFLLDNGAKPNQKNRQAQTAFDLIPENRSDIKKLFIGRLLWRTWQLSLKKNLKHEQPENKTQLSAANGEVRKGFDHRDGCYYTDNPNFSPAFYHLPLPREVLEVEDTPQASKYMASV